MDTLAVAMQLVGALLALSGLWFVAGGLRVVVSGRIDERRRSANLLKRGVPILVVGLLLLFGVSLVSS